MANSVLIACVLLGLYHDHITVLGETHTYIYVVATASMSAKVVASVYISDQSQLIGTFSDSRAME